MDVAGAAKEIALLKGGLKQSHERDKELLRLVEEVCDTVCEVMPQFRQALLRRARSRLDEFEERGQYQDPASILQIGLQQIVRRCADESDD